MFVMPLEANPTSYKFGCGVKSWTNWNLFWRLEFVL